MIRKKFRRRVTLSAAAALLVLPAAQAQQPRGKDVDAAQERLSDCNREAGERQGFARNEFMSACMKASEPRSAGRPIPDPLEDAQGDRPAACERQAALRQLRSGPRDAFLRECLARTG